MELSRTRSLRIFDSTLLTYVLFFEKKRNARYLLCEFFFFFFPFRLHNSAAVDLLLLAKW